ncbi:hypothetical protein [Endozoicomonas sp. ALB115]|uniref:hypothetical protein n=1 Tax=Endozoicomonas sp. ALB115 TaxID=3403074 RepID=UPI003BB56240
MANALLKYLVDYSDVTKAEKSLKDLRTETKNTVREARSLNDAYTRVARTQTTTTQATQRTTQATRETTNANSALNDAISSGRSTAVDFTKSLSAMALGAIGITTAVDSLTNAVGYWLDVTTQASQQNAQLEYVVDKLGASIGFTREELRQFALAMGRDTLTSTEEVNEAMVVLQSYFSITGDHFKETIKLAQDMATVFGGGLVQSTNQLAKALEDPIRGVNALRRSGVTFTKAEQDMIKALVESNQLFEAQELVLEKVNAQVGGQGVKAANGFAGAIDTVGENWHELMRTIGESQALINTVNSLASSLESVTDFLTPDSVKYARGFLDTLSDKTPEQSMKALSDEIFRLQTEIGNSGKAYAAAKEELAGFADRTILSEYNKIRKAQLKEQVEDTEAAINLLQGKWSLYFKQRLQGQKEAGGGEPTSIADDFTFSFDLSDTLGTQDKFGAYMAALDEMLSNGQLSIKEYQDFYDKLTKDIIALDGDVTASLEANVKRRIEKIKEEREEEERKSKLKKKIREENQKSIQTVSDEVQYQKDYVIALQSGNEALNLFLATKQAENTLNRDAYETTNEYNTALQTEIDKQLELIGIKNQIKEIEADQAEAKQAELDRLKEQNELMFQQIDILGQLSQGYGSSLADGISVAIEQYQKLFDKNDQFVGSQEQVLGAVSGIAGAFAQNLDKDSGAYKVMAITQATIATYLAATKALAELGPIAGPVAAGAITGLGLANVAMIASAKDGWSNVGDGSFKNYAGGTSMVTGGGTSKSDSVPTMLSRGEAVLTASAAESLGRNNIDAMNAGRGISGGTVSPVINAGITVQGNVDQAAMAGLDDLSIRQTKMIAKEIAQQQMKFQLKPGGILRN